MSRPSLGARIAGRAVQFHGGRQPANPAFEFARHQAERADPLVVPTRHGPVRCDVFLPPPDAPLAARRPVHLQLHGGGFMIRSNAQDDQISRYISAETGAVVVSPDYLTGPQSQYPTAEHQVYDIAVWLSENATQRGWDTAGWSLGGISAGGKLALNVLQQAASEDVGLGLRCLILGFAVADVTRHDRTSPKRFPAISPLVQRLSSAAYFTDPGRRFEKLASPFFDPDLAKGMPPALILTGELDTLGPEMDALAVRLRNEGVEITHRCFPGVDHGFAPKTQAALAHEAFEMVRDHMLTHLSRPATRS